MSIASKLLEVNDIKRDLSAAISEVSSTAAGVGTAGLTEIPSYINNIVLKEPLTEPKDINFIDYDGTLLYAYTADEFIAQNSLPTPPSHKGLVFEGWNWDLADLLEYAGNGIRVDVGALYITDDRKTRVYVTKEEGLLDQVISFYQNVARGVTVDWGDGTQSVSGTSARPNLDVQVLTHTYANPGDYAISISLVSGCNLYIGPPNTTQSASNYQIVGREITEKKYFHQVKKIELGERVHVRTRAFALFKDIESISIASGTDFSYTYNSFYGSGIKVCIVPKNANLMNYACSDCYKLKYVCPSKNSNICNDFTLQNCNHLEYILIPQGANVLKQFCFYNTWNVRRADIPSNITELRTQVFRYCYRLERIYIPETVTTIDKTNQFSECWNAKEIIIKANITAIPSQFCMSCYSACLIDIPASVTSIAAQAFIYCYRCQTLIVRATTPPTLANVNAFGGLVAKQSGADAKFTVIQDLVKIYVPYSSDHSVLNAYKTATNWSTWADRFVELDANGNIGS